MTRVIRWKAGDFDQVETLRTNLTQVFSKPPLSEQFVLLTPEDSAAGQISVYRKIRKPESRPSLADIQFTNDSEGATLSLITNYFYDKTPITLDGKETTLEDFMINFVTQFATASELRQTLDSGKGTEVRRGVPG